MIDAAGLRDGAEQARRDLWTALEWVDEGRVAEGSAMVGTVIEWLTSVQLEAQRETGGGAKLATRLSTNFALRCASTFRYFGCGGY